MDGSSWRHSPSRTDHRAGLLAGACTVASNVTLSPEFRLLLACVQAGDSRQQQEAISALLEAELDWTRFAEQAVAHQVASLVAHKLTRLVPDAIPPELLDAFHTIMESAQQDGEALFAELVRLMAALAAHGIDAVPFKGPALAIQAYGTLGQRIFNDLDFLVRDTDLPGTIGVLDGLGYRRQGDLTAAQNDLIHRLQGQDIIFGAGNGIAIEPHTRLTSLKFALDIDYAGLWQRVHPIRLRDQTLLSFAPEDTVLLLTIHGGKELWRKLKWACDFAAYVSANSAIDWDSVAERACAQGCRRMLVLAAALMHRCFAVPMPQPLIRAEQTDPTIPSLLRRIITTWQAEQQIETPSNKVVSLDRLRLHDGLQRQMRYVARTVFLPGPHHVAAFALPRRLAFAYVPIKLAHDLLALPAWRAAQMAFEPLPYVMAGSGIPARLVPAPAETRTALRACRAALARAKRRLAHDDKDAAAWRELADAFAGLRRFKRAIACYDTALSLAPGDTASWKRRAALLHAAGAANNAAAEPQEPRDAAEWVVQARRQLSIRHYAEAVEASDAALALDPGNLDAARIGIVARLRACDWRRRDADERKLAEIVQSGRNIPRFAHQAMSDSAADRLATARVAAARYLAPRSPLWRGERYHHDKLRIAYVSTGLHEDPLAGAMARCCAQHDRLRFSTLGVSLAPRANNGVFDQFVTATGMTDADIAALLREHEIDIAVALNGEMGDCPPGIFRFRPAPLQVNFPGHAASSGLPFIDYILADRTVITPAEPNDYTEQVVYLPHGFMPNGGGEVAAATYGRAEAGLPAAGCVFAFHDVAQKITPATFDLWMRLLRATDDSVLWLAAAAPDTVLNLRREASARGIDPQRLVFAPPLADDEDPAVRLRLADLFLDTWPHNAQLVAADSLRACVPLITRPGNTFAGRIGASLLASIGMEEFVTAAAAEYEALAIRLARDPQALAAAKTRLMHACESRRLFDTGRFIRGLEAAYRAMWQRHRDGLPPVGFAVESAMGEAQ